MSKHVSKLDPALNETCRSITGCLRPTSVENIYLLAGIAPPGVRRATTSRQERKMQTEDPRHSLYSHESVNKRLKSRNSFVLSVTPLDTNTPAELRAWTHHMRSVPQKQVPTISAYTWWNRQATNDACKSRSLLS